jgi:multidrug efflux pump subunit AcrA (membrane-fusion protein)
MNNQQKQVKKDFINKQKVIGLAVILLAVVIFMILKMTRPEQPAIEVKQKTWPIKSMTVKLDNLAPVYNLYGTVESGSLVTASAPISGIIDNVSVKDGDEVSQGELLVALAASDLELPFEVASADVADITAQLKLQDLNYQANIERLEHEKSVLKIKQQDVKRNRELISKKLLSQSGLEQSIEARTRQEFAVVGAELSVQENKAKVEQLKARLGKAQANLKQAQVNMRRGVVKAPFDSRIVDVHVSQGDRVNVNSAMVTYYALESLELRAKIPVAQMGMVYQALEAGEHLSARLNFNGKVYVLSLKRLDGQAMASGVDAFFDIPEELKMLRSGDLLEVHLLGRTIENSFSVPYSAIYGSDGIYRIDNDVLQAARVEVLGDTLVNGSPMALLKGDVVDGDMLAITHLPNAISGLKVTVTGKD